jgi:hypothetical protein
MPKKVSKIDLVFSIEGRGTVIALAKESEWSIGTSEAIHRQERVQIRTPIGTCILTFVREIESINRGPDRGSVGLLLPRSIRPEHVPEGSELWLERDGNEPLIEPP